MRLDLLYIIIPIFDGNHFIYMLGLIKSRLGSKSDVDQDSDGESPEYCVVL